MSTIGWVIYNGNLPSSKFVDFARMLQEAAHRQNGKLHIYKNNDLLSFLVSNEFKILKNTPESLPDYVIFIDKDIYLARQLESLGIPVFNSSRAIEISDDKILTYQELVKEEIPIPSTIIAPKIFSTGTIEKNMLTQVIERLGLPLVIKEAFGSFGEQVYLVHSEAELLEKVEQLQGKPFLFQSFLKSSFGQDLRLQVVGNHVVAAMKRTSEQDFRANVTSGGKMENYSPTTEEKVLAIRAAKAIGADFAGVDILFGPDDSRYVCEVNSNAHIRNLFDCTGINAADYIVRHILRQIN